MARTVTCTRGHVLTGADDAVLYRLGNHGAEAHPDLSMTDDQIREFIPANGGDA